MNKTFERRLAKGLCRSCGLEPKPEGYANCGKCRRFHAAKMAIFRVVNKYRANGVRKRRCHHNDKVLWGVEQPGL